MTGGEGSDEFVFGFNESTDEFGNPVFEGFGHDTITDFGAGDVLNIWGGYGMGGLNTQVSWTQTSTIITVGAGTTWESYVELENYLLPSYEADWLTSDPSDEYVSLSGSIEGVVSDDHMIGDDGMSDMLEGYAGDDTLEGLGGGDQLYGGVGNDTLDGGLDGDNLYGGAGDDVLTGGEGFDQFVFYFDESMDEFGNPVFESFGHDTITDFGDGDLLDIWGGYGMGGLNTQVSWTQTSTIITVGAGTAWESSVELENYLLPSYETDSLTSDPSDEYVSLSGSIEGVVSDDHIIGDDGMSDMLEGYAGDDTLEGLDGNDQLYGGVGNDMLDGGLDGDNLYGGDGDDALNGGDGFDQLFGGSGNDILEGGSGPDDLTGGDGSDVFVFEASLPGDQDFVWDFAQGEDLLHIASDAFAAGTTKQDVISNGFASSDGVSTDLFLESGGVIRLENVAVLTVDDFELV
jgi:Ca2+-binding RTX toxin-like protein